LIDIGADHGILAAVASIQTTTEVYAVERSLVAAKKGLIPLIDSLGLHHKIKVFVGDGLSPLLENKLKVDTIVLAGMGATTAAQILCRCGNLNFSSHKLEPSRTDIQGVDKAKAEYAQYSLSNALDTLSVKRIILQLTPPNMIPLLSVFKILLISGWNFENQVIVLF
jgi:hypothetical protein